MRLLICVFSLFCSFAFASSSLRAEEAPRYNNIFFYKNYKGSNQSLLALAEKMSQSSDYKEVANGYEIYTSILGNASERFTISERKLAQKKIRNLFFWNCDLNVSCFPIPQKLDANLTNISFEKPFYNIEKWGITQHQLENLDDSIVSSIVKPQYRYKELIDEARKGDISAMIIASIYFRSSGLVADSANLEAEYLKTAADLGNAYAMGRYAFFAKPSPPLTSHQRDKYMQMAADLGDPDSLVRLSVKSDNQVEKLQYLMKAADKNSVSAFTALGFFYSEAGDYYEAFKWHKKAFDNRETIIISDLSFMFQESAELFGDRARQVWMSEVESKDQTIAKFRELDIKKMNVYTLEEKRQNWLDFIKLAGEGGYGSVLAAELLETWYSYAVKCKPKGEMSYECIEDKI